MFPVSSCCCLCPIHLNQVLSWEWRCSWSSADRRCSNYIWVINNFIAYKGAAYIRDFTVITFPCRTDDDQMDWWFRVHSHLALTKFPCFSLAVFSISWPKDNVAFLMSCFWFSFNSLNSKGSEIVIHNQQAEPWWRASIWRSHRKVVIKQCSYHNNIIDIQNRLPYSKVVYPAIIVLFSCLMEVNHGVRTGPDYPFR